MKKQISRRQFIRTTAVAAGPGSALAHEALGTAQFFAGDLENARHSLSRAVELNALSSCTHLTTAKLMAAEDEIEGALDEAQTATLAGEIEGQGASGDSFDPHLHTFAEAHDGTLAMVAFDQ